MKRIAVLMALFMAIPMDALAQGASVSEKPNMFPTKAACEAALASGNFRFYEPRFYGFKSREPVDGINRIVVPLESHHCVHMQVVGGRRFVVQKEGTEFRAHKLADGSLSLYARNDCGNRVYDAVLPPPQPVPVAEVERPARTLHMSSPPPPREEDWEPVYRESEVDDDGRNWWKWALGGVAVLGAGYAVKEALDCPPGTKRRW